MNSEKLPKTRDLRFAVVGYSTRALAEAVAALGFDVVAIDHFCDSDTVSSAECIAVTDWPDGIAEAVERLDVDGILLAGGMENLSSVVERLGDTGKLLGPPHATIAQLRDTQFLCGVAGVAVIGFPEIAAELNSDHHPSDWLWKPLCSSGGIGIRSGLEISDERLSKPGYWQRRVSGRSIGASCIVVDRKGYFIGATESLSSHDSPGPQPFIYRGSMGPIGLTPQQVESVERLCDEIAAETAISGWLQFDFVESDDKQLWLIECNPRWTAGMEILRIGCVANMAQLHLAACHYSDEGIPKTVSRPWDRWAGKSIFYAEKRLAFSHSLREMIETELRNWSQAQETLVDRVIALDIADVPAGEQVFETGHPVLTLRLQFVRRAEDTEQAAMQHVVKCLQQGREIVSCVLSNSVQIKA